MAIEYRELKTESDLEQGYVVLLELRPQLNFERYLTLYNAAKRSDNFTLLGAFQDGRCVAVIGYRVLFDFIHWKHIY